MGEIVFVASQPQHVDHLAPLYAALDLSVRGSFYVRRPIPAEGAADETHADADDSLMGMVTRAADARLDPRVLEEDERIDDDGGVLVLASLEDIGITSGHAGRVALIEPGIGQTYVDDDPPAHGSGVGLVLALNDGHATTRMAAFPSARVVVVGSPKLDALFARPPKPVDDPPTVAIAFRPDDGAEVPERRGALEHYRPALARLHDAGVHVLGHGHPDAAHWRQLEKAFSASGIELVRRFEDVVRRADLYVADNTSTLFEFAALDRPVIVLNAPWYRRDVEHGLRFWQFADVGVQVDEPETLVDAIGRALEDRDGSRRRAIVRALYANPGDATARAADELVSFLTDAAPRDSSAAVAATAAGGWRPRRRSDVDILTADDGYIVYQANASKVHHLNPSAAVILELSTGEHSVDDITELVRDLWDLDRAPAPEVTRLLGELVREGLVEPPASD